ncbi:uncharacterized protein B0H64DRAFT_192079 [Chaetomium fimeti]|uniref:Uncharacterized protein n=1 Tax=Chaetomium fimeti TaxID=1854472 RepID=A0AAE0LRC6_9PEZI|nr:hypothetical protein B0H64DRAFT_192079 [Chaetomium fimeti]
MLRKGVKLDRSTSCFGAGRRWEGLTARRSHQVSVGCLCWLRYAIPNARWPPGTHHTRDLCVLNGVCLSTFRACSPKTVGTLRLLVAREGRHPRRLRRGSYNERIRMVEWRGTDGSSPRGEQVPESRLRNESLWEWAGHGGALFWSCRRDFSRSNLTGRGSGSPAARLSVISPRRARARVFPNPGCVNAAAGCGDLFWAERGRS